MRRIIKLFNEGNVCVCGERGTGKDMLFGNVIARRGKNYISNTPYPLKSKKKALLQTPLDFKELSMAGNTYRDFLNGTVKYWVYPWTMGEDIYISDVGVYLPSQFCNELNRDYKGIPQFCALSRQVAQANVFINLQALNRAWDKLREQSRRYITCQKCRILKLPFDNQLVIQRVRIHEKYQSCLDNVPPLRIPLPLYFMKDQMRLRLTKLNYTITHGKIKELTLIYFNKSAYKTDIFKDMLEGGIK